jgi:hypothetical protein
MNYFHVTLKANVDSIYQHGIDRVFSQGKKQLSWFVTHDRLPWAIAHCSARHNVTVNELVIFPVPSLRLKNVKRFRYPGIVATPCRTKVDIHTAAILGLDPQGVNDERDAV